MMASLVINSIRSALNALESSEEDRDSDEREWMKYLLKTLESSEEDRDSDERQWMKYLLKTLELFVLCARKLENDALLRFHSGKFCTLASLFQRIHHALSRNPPPYNVKNIKNLSCAIGNYTFIEEISGWYNTSLVSLPQPTSFDELNEIIGSLLDNLHLISSFCESSLLQPIKALIEKITFLRNFIRFATLRSIESPQLLAQIQAVAVDAAHTSFMDIFEDYDEVEEYYVKPNIPVLLQMIKMVDPQVDETYTQALTSAKLSTHLLSPIIMKDFIDSLLWNLWERLHLDPLIVISPSFEFGLVYEGLRRLRSMLKEQPNKFDKRIGELTRVLICDAGIFIFSLYQREMEIDVPDSGLLQRINRITQIMKGKDFSIPDLMLRFFRVEQMVKGKDFSIPYLVQFGQGLSHIRMLASLVIDSIRSDLNVWERSEYTQTYEEERHVHHLKRYLKRYLEHLELFVRCARILGNDAQLRFHNGKVSTLASLFRRIHRELSRNPSPDNLVILENVKRSIANFYEEIRGGYNTFLVSLPQPTCDQVSDIIDLVLEHLNDVVSFASSDGRPIQPIEALIEKITFLRNFIRFATLRSVEPPQLFDKLLAHIHAVAVDAAHTSFIYISPDYDVEPNVQVLLQMIKMVDPQVDEIYTQALTSSKLSTHLLSPVPHKDHDPSVIMKDFIDCLLWNLWERLHTATPIIISTNSELQLVYEGLRLLRSMLKSQPNKFDKRIGELTRVVICDAGIMIFSLNQREMDIFVPTSGLQQRINRITQRVNGKDFPIPDILQRISRIRQRVEEKYLSIPNLLPSIHSSREQVGGNNLPRANDLGFIDFVLENLLELTCSKACYGFQSQFRMIHNELSSLRYSLGKIEGLLNDQKDLEALWNDGIKVVYRVEFLIDRLVFGDFQDSSSTSFDSTVEDILKEVKSVNFKIHPAPDIKVKKVSMTPNPVPSQNRVPVADEMVGFEDDITSVIYRLTRGSKQLKVVAIVGMAGMGKTTLATKVFNHPSVTYHFHALLQCCVSQSFRKKKLLLELLNLVDPNTNNKMSEQDLSEKLRKHLKGKRYLIFLDDVWDIEAWDNLKASFPDDSYGSRILVTSRQHHAVPQAMLDGEPLSPSKLTEDQSWELLQKKLPPRNEWFLALDEIGKQIAANCKGLPLTVVIVAGFLSNTEPEGWKMFLESISSFSGADHCMDILELSYKHLPCHLKQCFLYFGLFPEDHEVSIKRLIWLWIAEGFVRNNESKSLEEVGRDYMMDLVGRSLVMVSKERSIGGVKACRIHDLLHDFCRNKAKEENFLQVLEGGYDEFISFKEPGYIRRLCVHSKDKHLKNLRLFCPRLHSLLFFANEKHGKEKRDISFIIPRYRRLRVLDIGEYPSHVWFGIPSEIGLVIHLKYLSVTIEVKYLSETSDDIYDIPSSIGSLANLETFILNSDVEVSLPDTFWNLRKLRHLCIRNSPGLNFGDGLRFPIENLENCPELCELQSCSKAIIRHGESIERLVRKFPNIRKLRCHLDCNAIEILIPNSLKQLESLYLTSDMGTLELSQTNPRFEFDFPGNLRKLSLFMFEMHQSDVSRIGKLPNLEVLKFRVYFYENTWDMVEGEFSKLKFLYLVSTELVRWTASDDQFPYLQKLVLGNCFRLEELPCCFESIGTLEMVDVHHCSPTVHSFFERIQDERKESGFSLPKIQSDRG